jgi:hypothetical protein
MLRARRVFWAAGLTLVLIPVARGVQPAPGDKAPDAAAIQKLIRQLGSAKFAERQAASARLEAIGEPAVSALREAARDGDNLELRQRAGMLADRIEHTVLTDLLAGGTRHVEARDFKKAIPLLEKAIARGLAKYGGPREADQQAEELPYVAHAYVQLARAYRGMQDVKQAVKVYHLAMLSVNYSSKRSVVEQEWSAMTAAMTAEWWKGARPAVEKDPALKALLGKHALVVLHSRRFAGGFYFQSAYSFVHETGDPEKHRNDVQLLFDNGGRPGMLSVNMVGGQQNRIADLGRADFEKDPDPAKVGGAGKAAWHPEESAARAGHVYLEEVRDDAGNHFHVVFQVLAVDPDARFVALVWRRLPGGKVVRER